MDKIFKILIILFLIFPMFSVNSEEMNLVDSLFEIIVSDCSDYDIKIKKNTIVNYFSKPNFIINYEYIIKVEDIINHEEKNKEFKSFLSILINREFNDYFFLNGEPYYTGSIVSVSGKLENGEEFLADHRGYKVLVCGDNHLDIKGKEIYWNSERINNGEITDIDIDKSVNVSNIEDSSIIAAQQIDLSSSDIEIDYNNEDTFWTEFRKNYLWPVLASLTTFLVGLFKLQNTPAF